MSKNMINKSREPFSVRQKDFWDIGKSRSLLSPKFAASLSHEPDGLIFQPSIMVIGRLFGCQTIEIFFFQLFILQILLNFQPYTPGPCPDVLKWKPAHMNSVDFKLKIAEESGMG